MKRNFSSDVRRKWLIDAIGKLLHIAAERDLELIYQFSKELIEKG